jgi:glycolate oxidase
MNNYNCISGEFSAFILPDTNSWIFPGILLYLPTGLSKALPECFYNQILVKKHKKNMDRKIIAQLQKIVGPANVLTSDEDRRCYSYDGTALEYMPEAVVLPGSSAEISLIMRLATAAPFIVVPRGAGSGMTGGSLPIKGGLVMGLGRLNHILEIDRENQLAIVEPGVITGNLQSEARKRGLFYPPDPASANFCTMGGNAAECSGGPSAVKYGVTRDYVKGLEVVLADGRIIHTGVRTDKGVVGYDLTRLFVGSEGTLGIISKIIVALRPLPAAKKTFLVQLDSITRAAELVAKILAVFTPCTLEFMDHTAITIVADKMPFSLKPETMALLLLELDGTAEAVAAEGDKLAEFLAARPGVMEVRQGRNKAEIEALWIARKQISPAAFKLKPHKLSEDIVVPRTSIPAIVTFAETMAAELDLLIFTFGHAGDGNIHVNIMLDKNEARQRDNGAIAKERLFAKVIALGGTLSGEHGIGCTKGAYLGLEIDANTMAVMRMLKVAFDPKNILNPGKIFPQKG